MTNSNDPSKKATGQRDTIDHLVVLIHGINTRALWMGEIKPVLEEAGFYVASTSYGRFGFLRFLAPFHWLRKKAISRVITDIKIAMRTFKMDSRNELKHMSVISHSFGTYMVSRIISEHPEFQWERIIFCGSVVREDFSFDQILERFHPPLLNEIGTEDYWPALAESAGWGYGSVGSTGFNRPPVETRWHKGFRHSDFLKKDFCKRHWIPFLHGEKARPGDAAAELPLWIRAITLLPLRYILLALTAAFVWYSSQYFAYVSTQIFESVKMAWLAKLAPSTPLTDVRALEGEWWLFKSGRPVFFRSSPVGMDVSFAHEASVLPWGTASPTTPQGKHHSNISISGKLTDCYYFVTQINDTLMHWELRAWEVRGAGVDCFETDMLIRQ